MSGLIPGSELLLAIETIATRDGSARVDALADHLGQRNFNLRRSIDRAVAGDTVAFDGETCTLTDKGRRIIQAERLAAGEGEPGSPAEAAVGPVVILRYDETEEDPSNPRTDLDTDEGRESIEQLRSLIVQRGELLQPIQVRPRGENGKYRLVFGHRRRRAVGRAIEDADLPADFPIPATVRDYSEAEALVAAVEENVARRDMHPLDEAEAFRTLVRDHGWSTQDVADRFEIGVKTVQDRLAVVEKLDAETRARMRLPADDPDHLTYKAARQLLRDQGAADAVGKIALTDAARLALLETFVQAWVAPDAPWSTPWLNAPKPSPRPTGTAGVPPASSTPVEDEPGRAGGSTAAARRRAEEAAAPLTPADRLILAELAHRLRRDGRLLARPRLGALAPELARAIPAEALAHDLPSLEIAQPGHAYLLTWSDDQHGRLVCLSDLGKRALSHFAPALANLDRSDAEAEVDLLATIAQAGHDPAQYLLDWCLTGWLNQRWRDEMPDGQPAAAAPSPQEDRDREAVEGARAAPPPAGEPGSPDLVSLAVDWTAFSGDVEEHAKDLIEREAAGAFTGSTLPEAFDGLAQAILFGDLVEVALWIAVLSRRHRPTTAEFKSDLCAAFGRVPSPAL